MGCVARVMRGVGVSSVWGVQMSRGARLTPHRVWFERSTFSHNPRSLKSRHFTALEVSIVIQLMSNISYSYVRSYMYVGEKCLFLSWNAPSNPTNLCAGLLKEPYSRSLKLCINFYQSQDSFNWNQRLDISVLFSLDKLLVFCQEHGRNYENSVYWSIFCTCRKTYVDLLDMSLKPMRSHTYTWCPTFTT